MESNNKFFHQVHAWDIARICLAIFLIWFVLQKVTISQIVELREQISAPWLAPVLFLYITLTILKAFQYYFLIGRQVPYSQVLNIVVVQNAISNFIATSAGIASYLALFRAEQGVKLTRAAMAFLLTKVGDLISVWLFLLVSSLFVWPQVNALHSLIAVLLAVIGGAVFLFFVIVLMRQKFVFLLRSFLDRSWFGRIGVVTKAINILQSLAEQEHGFVFRMVGVGILFSLIYMAVTMLWLYASLQAFSFDTGILPVVFVNVLMQLVSYLPIQVFGGLGVAETTMLYFYGFFNFPQTELAAVLIGNRLLFYLTNLAVLLYLPLHALYFKRQSKLIK